MIEDYILTTLNCLHDIEHVMNEIVILNSRPIISVRFYRCRSTEFSCFDGSLESQYLTRKSD